MAKAKNYFWKVYLYFGDGEQTASLADNPDKCIAYLKERHPNWTHWEVRDEMYNTLLRKGKRDDKEGSNS